MEDQKVFAVQKGGEFIIADAAPIEIYTPEDMDEEKQMIRNMVKDFVDTELRSKGDILSEQVSLMEKAAELGLLGPHMPEQYGGMNLDTITDAIIGEELGKGGGSFNTSIAAHTGIGMLPILYFGTEEQKNNYLPGLIDGRLKASYCLTEPNAGSDALSARTKAELTEDKAHYIINGQKMWISNAGFADVFIVFAQVSGHPESEKSGFTGFIVDKGVKGLSLGAEEDKLGIKGSSTRQVFFENVKVPVSSILGEIGKGHRIAFNVLNIGRYKLGLMAMGGAKEAIKVSVKYANERVQFKQAISNFGAMKHKIAQQSILTFASESATYRIADLMEDWKKRLMSEGKSYEEAKLLAAQEYAIECAILKVQGSETLDFVVDEMLQIHGGYGFSEEYAPARAYRNARINRIYEGTNEINRMLMVNMLLKKALKGELDLVGPAWAVQKELTKMPSFKSETGAFSQEIKAVKNFKKIGLMVAGAAVKYQMDGKIDLKTEQEILMNIADILIEVFTAESLLLRVQKTKENIEAQRAEVYQSILSVYLHDAQAKVSKHALDALASFALGDELRIMAMGVTRFSKYPLQNVKKLRREIADYLIDANGYIL